MLQITSQKKRTPRVSSKQLLGKADELL